MGWPEGPMCWFAVVAGELRYLERGRLSMSLVTDADVIVCMHTPESFTVFKDRSMSHSHSTHRLLGPLEAFALLERAMG